MNAEVDADARRPTARAAASAVRAIYARKGDRWRPNVEALDRLLADLRDAGD